MEERRSLSVLVDNEAGVLSQVSRLFSRKGYNIESLAVGTTSDPKVSRITIEVLADQRHAELLCNQLRKLLPVHSVKLLRPDNSLRREMILMKVSTPDTETCNRVMQVASIFRASIIDVSPSTLTIAMIGEESKVEGILSRLYDYYTAHPDALPEDFRGIIEHEGTERAATDYISGMTDGYAMEKYGELFIPFAWTVK